MTDIDKTILYRLEIIIENCNIYQNRMKTAEIIIGLKKPALCNWAVNLQECGSKGQTKYIYNQCATCLRFYLLLEISLFDKE